jgi:hypothetical protein
LKVYWATLTGPLLLDVLLVGAVCCVLLGVTELLVGWVVAVVDALVLVVTAAAPEAEGLAAELDLTGAATPLP